MVRAPLNKITRKKVNTLLIIDVHARDIVDGFVRESVLNAKEFSWESQLRFYWDRDLDDCVIKQCTGTFRYNRICRTILLCEIYRNCVKDNMCDKMVVL